MSEYETGLTRYVRDNYDDVVNTFKRFYTQLTEIDEHLSEYI